MTDLEKLIAREDIHISITTNTLPTNNYSSWMVTLKYSSRKYTTPFFTVEGKGPRIADVIHSLCKEVYSLEGTDGQFEKWAPKFGYSIDSRSAYTLWQSIVKIAPKFKTFLGPKLKEFFMAKHTNGANAIDRV